VSVGLLCRCKANARADHMRVKFPCSTVALPAEAADQWTLCLQLLSRPVADMLKENLRSCNGSWRQGGNLQHARRLDRGPCDPDLGLHLVLSRQVREAHHDHCTRPARCQTTA